MIFISEFFDSCDFEFEDIPIILILYFFANFNIEINSLVLPLLEAITRVSFFEDYQDHHD